MAADLPGHPTSLIIRLRRPAKRVLRALFSVFGLEVHSMRAPASGVHASLGSHVLGVLERGRVDCVIDVGGHEGEFGRLLRSNGWTGPIVSFEPVSASFDRLVAATVDDPLWTVHRLALGREEGRRMINVLRGTDFSSFLQPNATGSELFAQGTAPMAAEEVEVRRLDDVLLSALAGPLPERAFLKMDTQGFDMEVFAGATRVIGRIVGIQSELSLRPIYEGMPNFLDALRELQAAGFAITGFYPVARDQAWRVIEYDCVMVRS